MKSHLVLLAVLVLAGSTLGPSALGQQVYKCGSTYSQKPCAGALTVDVTDTRTRAQKAQTDAAAVQSAKLADQLEKERLALEKASAAKPPKTEPRKKKASATGAAAASAAKAGTKPKKLPPEYFVARTNAEKKEDKKAAVKTVDQEKQ